LELVRKIVPGAKIEIVSGVGHFSQMEAAGEVNRVIEGFVGGLAPR
jgi:pimeloyl-ACP methyl ester carboxylesterase